MCVELVFPGYPRCGGSWRVGWGAREARTSRPTGSWKARPTSKCVLSYKNSGRNEEACMHLLEGVFSLIILNVLVLVLQMVLVWPKSIFIRLCSQKCKAGLGRTPFFGAAFFALDRILEVSSERHLKRFTLCFFLSGPSWWTGWSKRKQGRFTLWYMTWDISYVTWKWSRQV